MTDKPTYEELEQRVKKLEKEAIERKQAEESLREEKEFANSLINNAPTFFVAIDAQGKTTMMNQHMLKALGYKADEVVGKDYLSNFVPERERDTLASVFMRLTAEHKPTLNENHILSKDGKEYLVEWHGMPVFDTNGEFQYFYGVGIDITERKLTEEVLRNSERELSIRNRISAIFIKIPDDKMYYEVLKIVLESMESPFGSIAYINENGDRVVPTMTRDIWVDCEILDIDIVFPREKWSGIWGRCLINKETVISSGPFRVPEGHLPITRSMAVPIIHQGEAIGNFLVANKATDYGEKDKKLLESIADNLAPILHARVQRDRQEEEREKLISELQKALKEIKTLRGILPLCSFCKKIRDDKGYWEQVDVYIYKHSQADISHSICPECAKEHYPDLDI